MILEARLVQVNVRYSELSAKMADKAGKLNDRISWCITSGSGPALAPVAAPTQSGFPTASSTTRGSETQGARPKQPVNFTGTGTPTFGPEAAARAAQQGGAITAETRGVNLKPGVVAAGGRAFMDVHPGLDQASRRV